MRYYTKGTKMSCVPPLGLADHRIRADLEAIGQIPKIKPKKGRLVGGGLETCLCKLKHPFLYAFS